VQLSAVPVQLAHAVNVTPSLFQIATVYAVITEPPSTGATQLIMTSVSEITVVGAAGVLGTDGDNVTVISCERITVE
jgi:hypothetical protein